MEYSNFSDMNVIFIYTAWITFPLLYGRTDEAPNARLTERFGWTWAGFSM
jgi:hypothetical protein